MYYCSYWMYIYFVCFIWIHFIQIAQSQLKVHPRTTQGYLYRRDIRPVIARTPQKGFPLNAPGAPQRCPGSSKTTPELAQESSRDSWDLQGHCGDPHESTRLQLGSPRDRPRTPGVIMCPPRERLDLARTKSRLKKWCHSYQGVLKRVQKQSNKNPKRVLRDFSK